MTDTEMVAITAEEYQELLMHQPLKGEFTPTGWTAPEEGLPYPDWCFNMQSMSFLRGASNLWFGDHINYGDHAYGEKYAAALPDPYSSHDPGSIRNIASVCRRVPMSLRNDKNKWSHYVVVSPYEHDVIVRLLAMTLKHKWKVSRLRECIARWFRRFGPLPVKRPSHQSREGVSYSLPLYTTVREEVEDQYPTAPPVQTAQMAEFVVQQIEKYATTPVGEINLRKHAKRVMRYRKMSAWWMSRYVDAEAEVAGLMAENKMLVDQMIELQGDLVEKHQSNATWAAEIMLE